MARKIIRPAESDVATQPDATVHLYALLELWQAHEHELGRLGPGDWSPTVISRLERRSRRMDALAQKLGYALLAAAGAQAPGAWRPAGAPELSLEPVILPSVMSQEDAVDALLRVLGRPTQLNVYTEVVEEFSALRELITEANLSQWLALPDLVRVRTVEFLAARLRALQSHREVTSGAVADAQSHMRGWFSMLSEHMRQGYPGHAHGLARDHTPRDGSWYEDALARLEDLKALKASPEEH